MTDELIETDRLLTKAEILEITGFSYSSIWSWMRSGRFPRSLAVSGRVRWREREIRAWLENLPRQRLKGDPPSDPGRQDDYEIQGK